MRFTLAEAGVPFPLPDESVESFLVRSKLLNQTSEYLGSVPTITASARIDPCGRSIVQEKIWQLPALVQLNEEDRIALSYHDFFKPFIEAKKPFGDSGDSARRILFRGGGVPKYCAEEIKVAPAFCPQCTATDIEQRGYSYWRRMHQIRCNLVCAVHRSWLLLACPYCEQPFLFGQLPSQRCRCCGQSLFKTDSGSGYDEAMADVFFRVALCIELIFSGGIQRSLDIEKMGKHIHSKVPSRIPNTFNNVARRVCNTVDESVLCTLGVHPSVRPNFGWPATYLSGRWYETRPTFDLLLFGVFGYGLHIDEYWCRERPQKMDGRSFQQGKLDYEFLRRLYRAKNWSAAAESMSISLSHASKVYGSYPGLKSRVDGFRKRRDAVGRTLLS